MRLLYFISVANMEGSNISLLNLLRKLRSNGYNCKVIATCTGKLINELTDIGVESEIVKFRPCIYPSVSTFKLAIISIPRFVLLTKNFFVRRRLLRITKSFQPDIIHTNVSTITIGYSIAKELHIPHVWHIREYLDKDFNIHPFPSMANRKKLLANSYTICITKDIQNHFDLSNNNKSIVVYNGIYDKKDIYYFDKKEPLFFFASFLMRSKGVYDLVKAFVEFYKYNPNSLYRLVLAGDYKDETKNELVSYLQKNDVLEKVVFLGRVSGDEVKEYYRKASVTFVPSYFEGFGRSTAEAMFNGCLVAGRDTGGTKEQFDNGFHFLGHEIGIRFKNEQEITKIMLNIAQLGVSPFSEMILDSQRVVKELYSNEANYNSITGFYKSILDGKI